MKAPCRTGQGECPDMGPSPHYKRNLAVLWVGNFFTGIGLSLVVPFLPLFIDTLGEFTRQELALYCGIIIAAPFLMQVIVSPLWGRLADRKGRKIMLLRAALGMSVFMAATGFAHIASCRTRGELSEVNLKRIS